MGIFLMSAVGEDEGKMTCIPNNMENYITFSLRSLQFIDSAQFMLASLDKLVNSMAKDGHDGVRIIRAYKLTLRKGVYSYENMDSTDRYREQVFPRKERFFSHLSG